MQKNQKMIHQLNFSGKLVSLEKPLIMGILNITQDSFYDGGRYLSEEAIVDRAAQILTEGADMIDVGAMSTRPNSMDVPEWVEIENIKNGVRAIKVRFPSAVVSVDTWRASVAKVALEYGADMINDVSGGTFDPDMIPLMGDAQVPYCLMHTPAKPDVMQQCTNYSDIIADMMQFFGRQLEKLHQANVHDIILDLGYGFGKTLEQNYFLMKNMQAFDVFDLPTLVGVSRKSMVYKLFDTTPQEALNGTTVLHTYALLHGAHILRVHDVKAAVEVRKICEMLK